MRISDWSSDVCSSDLRGDADGRARLAGVELEGVGDAGIAFAVLVDRDRQQGILGQGAHRRMRTLCWLVWAGLWSGLAGYRIQAVVMCRTDILCRRFCHRRRRPERIRDKRGERSEEQTSEL